MRALARSRELRLRVPQPAAATDRAADADLGPEPPAVANFLVNDLRVTDEAVPATLLDLAARRIVEIEERGPDFFYVRLNRSSATQALTPYERRVLEHVERIARDGVVPARGR